MGMFRPKAGAVIADLDARDRELIGQIPDLLGTVVPGSDDPGYGVLHRAAYKNDGAASREFEDLTAADASSQRRFDREIVSAVGEGQTELSREEAMSLLRSINEARLVLAARSGVMDGDEGWENRINDDPTLAAVAWLGYVQGELIAALGFDR
jgi:hypothetical protein